MNLPMITAMATLSVGFPNTTSHQNIYVNGCSDIYVDSHLSVRTDTFWFAGEQNQSAKLTDNHSFLSGIAYHFGTDRLDPYIAFQPGLALTRSDGHREFRLSPLVSSVAGARFFVSDQFHFFAEGRQVLGQHISDDPRSVSLSETRVAFGLGAQIGRKRD